MNDIVADTHIVTWYVAEPHRLSTRARAALDGAIAAGGSIFLPSISLVELCYLVEKGRLPQTLLDRIEHVLDLTGTPLVVVALDRAVAQAVHQIPRDAVPDMPDRFIAATALAMGLPLVTHDAKIRATTLQTIW